jgi:hypothetical protein
VFALQKQKTEAGDGLAAELVVKCCCFDAINGRDAAQQEPNEGKIQWPILTIAAEVANVFGCQRCVLGKR